MIERIDLKCKNKSFLIRIKSIEMIKKVDDIFIEVYFTYRIERITYKNEYERDADYDIFKYYITSTE